MDLIEKIDSVLAEAKKDDEYYRSEIGKLRKKIMDAGLDDDSPEVKKMTAEIKKLKKKIKVKGGKKIGGVPGHNIP